MKKTLFRLTMLLVTFLSLPSGAWGQTWNFAGNISTTEDEYVADATHWGTADSRWNYLTATDDDYLMVNSNQAEATKGLKFTAGAANGSNQGKIRINSNILNLNGDGVVLTIPSLKKGYTVQVVWKTADGNHYENYLAATTNLSDASKFAAAGTGNTPTDSNDQTATATVTDDGDVVMTATTGGVNIKSITVKDKNGTVMTKDQVIAATIFGAEEYVTEETTWTFNNYTLSNTVSTTSESLVKGHTNKLYNRSASSGRGFTYVALENAVNITFSDAVNTVLKINNIARSAAAYNNSNLSDYTAGTKGNNSTPFFAFNTTKAGTCYAYVKSSGGADKAIRIYYGKADGTSATSVNSTATTDVTEIKMHQNAGGVYFIGGVVGNDTRDIYAIRFVPDDADLTGRSTISIPEVTGGSVAVKVTGESEDTDFRTFANNTSLTLTASATENYAFVKWVDENDTEITEGVDANDSKILTLTLTEAKTVKPVFASTLSYAVTFTAAPTGGTVVVNNGTADIETGTEVGVGANVTITATPDLYFNTGTISVTKTDDPTTAVTVTNNAFTMPAYPVTISVAFTAEERVSAATTWLFDEYTAGTTVTATNKLYNRSASGRAWAFEELEDADKLTDYAFGGTTINVSTKAKNSSGNAIDATRASYLTAGFTGSKTINNNPTALGTEGTPFFAFNATVPGTCYALVKSDGTVQARIFFGKGDGTALTSVNTTSSTVTTIFKNSTEAGVFFVGGASANALREIYAIRFVPTRTITIASMSNGEVTADKSTGGEGDKITLTVNPADGYQLATLQANSVNVTKDSNDEYTFTMPDADVTITATFTEVPTYAVSASTSVENGQVGVDKASAAAGETVTITVTPNDGYRLKSGTLKATYNNGTSDVELEITNNQFTMPAYTVSVTAQFETLPAIYGTYDFRTFATDNIEFVGENDNVLATVELQNGVMTGKFTYDDPTKGTVTDNTMELNDAFSATNVQLRKKKNTPASTALLLPKSSTAQLTINRLSAGDWFVIETEADSKLMVKTANANISKLGSSETLAVNETIESGVKYLVSAATSIDLYNNNVANAHIYTITISNAEAISDPVIGDLSEGKVTITAGSSTASGTLKTYYTIDGSTPSASSTEYTAAVAIEQTRIVKAITINTTTSVASNVAIKKIVVDAATPSTIWDFVNDEALSSISFGDAIGVTGYYYNNGVQSSNDFNNITNAPVHSKMSWLLSNVTNSGTGLSSSSARAFSINDLNVGDKIYITYSSSDNKKIGVSRYGDDNHAAHGNKVTINGTEAPAGLTTFDSEAEIVVTELDNLTNSGMTANYVMFKPESANVIITKIEINPAFTLTKGTIDTDITNVQIKVGNADYADLGASRIIAKGTEVTLKAIFTTTNKNVVWSDGDDNVLTANEDGTLTMTMDADKTVKATLTTGVALTWIKDSQNKTIARKLNNGLLEVTFNNNGRITAIKDIETEKNVMIDTDDNQRGYFNFNYRPSQNGSVFDAGLECNSSGDIVMIGNSGSNQIELIYPMAPADPASNQTWKIGYVMKAGVRGIYTYAIMDGSSNYSELHEARYGWRVNPEIFNYAWVSDTQKGDMPDPSELPTNEEEEAGTNVVQDATYRLRSNPSTIYTKYDWANFVKDDQLHGIMGTNIGAWLISPSTEWVNGGPTKQELTVHATNTTPIILQTMHSRHFGAGSAVLQNSSEKKMFGPCLFYVNSGTQNAMIADAMSMAEAEVAAWPYSWFTSNHPIKSGLALTAEDRGTVTGTVNISGGFVTNKVQVVLTQGNKKPLLDGNGYQYYTEATVGSSFTINHVRPGTYTLYVYALDGDATGTYKKENVTVNAGGNDLGTISWMPDKLGVTLWRIGEADHSTKGFKLSDKKRQYGLWNDVPTADQTFTIGTSSEASNWYYAQVKNGSNWSIKFNNTESYTKPLKLTIATAGAAQSPKLEVKLNDKLLNTNGSYVFSNDAAIYRSGVLSGRDSLIVIDVPAAYMKVGENTINLKVSGLDSGVGGIMYDCIKLEDGSDVSEVIYDFRTWAEAHLSKNGEDHQADIVRNDDGVLTGSFTPQAGETVDGTMTLNGKFSIVGNKTDKISSYKLRKRGTDQNAGSGLLFPRCGKGEADFIINNLNPGEWFKLDAHASYHLQFAEENANVTQLGRTETVTRETEIIPGTVYKVKDDATSPVSVKICNSLEGGGQSFIYSVTISSGEAISEPTIGDLSGGKVTMTGGASTKGGTVKTFYTIDGSTPTSSSAEYTAAVAIDQTRIVKAVTINTTTGIASNVVTKKIKVDAATPATVWDFKNDATLKPLTYADEVYNGCYVNTSNQDKSDGKFKYVTNEKIHAKLSWQIEGSETANATVGNAGLAITKGGRAFAINDLHVGDKIYITYSNTGDTPLKTSICGNSRGCAISVNGGATVTSGNTTEIASGDEIEIKSTPEGYEYLVLMPADNKITITKIEINQHVVPEIVPSTPAVYDIAEIVAKGDTLAFSQTGVSVYNMEKSGNNWELKSRSDFYPVTNFNNKVSVRVGSSSLTYNMTAGTMQLRRAMAIHDLSVGDEIVVIYSGDGSLISVNSDRSDAFTVGGKALAAGEEISSGATIKITKTQEDNNYIVVNTSGTVYVQAIYVNTKAPTMVIRPKIELLEIGTTTATYRITHEEGTRLYYMLAKEGEEHRASTTGIYDFTLYESDRIKAWAKRSGVTSDTLSTVIYAPTPAPSESGDYDFFEQANELPADLEVTLDPSKSVTVGGQTLYKPTAMTAQTFNDKFAFTETNTTGKIKIRTNRTLAFNKGTNMNMALLNMKQGDIISFDYKGTISFANTSVIRKETSGVAGARGMTRAETDEMESGAVYVVQQDGDVLLNLSLTEDAISIAKMYVASAPGKSKAAAIDFATAAEEEEDLDQGGAAGVWCHEREAMIKFLRFTNQSDELPIDNKVSSENGYGTNTTSGFTSGNRNIAIHSLAKGDTIKVRFAGGAMMYYGHKSYGNRVSVNGQLLQPGDTIHSGDVLKVEQVDYLNNYVVLRVGSKAAISGIFINTLETEKVLMPTITPKSSNTFLITSGVSTVGNEVGTIYTLNGTDPSMVNGTGGPYESFEIQVVHGEEMTIKAMSYSSSGMVSRITTLYYNGSDLTPIESVKVDENGLTESETIMYDLQGRRVENPRPGNIYIINGKKVVYKRR